MEYETRVIGTKKEIDTCPAFHLTHYQWTCTRKPAVSGRMGYIPGEGIYLAMECAESDPKRQYQNHKDPVCNDSAMEAFFAFPDHPLQPGEGFVPTDDGLYLNFEFNANGAMYAKFGHGRSGREFLTPEEYKATGVRAYIEKDRWRAELLVPQTLITRLCGIERFDPGDYFYCNFYKISQDPAIEHYVSYNFIDNAVPNFHLPRFFAKAFLVKEN